MEGTQIPEDIQVPRVPDREPDIILASNDGPDEDKLHIFFDEMVEVHYVISDQGTIFETKPAPIKWDGNSLMWYNFHTKKWENYVGSVFDHIDEAIYNYLDKVILE